MYNNNNNNLFPTGQRLYPFDMSIYIHLYINLIQYHFVYVQKNIKKEPKGK